MTDTGIDREGRGVAGGIRLAGTELLMSTNDETPMADEARATIERLRSQIELYRRLYRVALELLKADRRRAARSERLSVGSAGSRG